MAKYPVRYDSSVGIVTSLRIRRPSFDFPHWAGFCFVLPREHRPSSARSRGTAVLFNLGKADGA